MIGPLEPFRIKVVEPIKLISKQEREKSIRAAGFNAFRLPAGEIFIDLLTDSGTSAMSDYQWAGMMQGDESYAGCRNFFHLKKTIWEIMGFEYILPAHQGCAAENILFSTLLSKGDVVPSNIHFDTTRANIEYLGAKAENCVIEEGLDPELEHPFKGNLDLQKLKKVYQCYGKNKIPLVCLTITNNSGGGQPVSMENIRQLAEFCHKNQLLFFLDAARFAENACFIKSREKEYQQTKVREIIREMFSYADGCWISAKKDALAVAFCRESGIRVVEIGSLMFASKNPQTDRWTYPTLELLRLTIPRRLYSVSHLQYVAESVIAIGKKREHLKGL